MTDRRILAVGALMLVVLLSGCLGLGGGGEIDEDDLTADAEYDWDTNATASYDVTTSSLLSFSSNDYKAVITVENRSTISIHQSTLIRGDQSVSIEALQFRFPNGTVVNATHGNLTAVEESDETEIRLPVENGTVGYSANWGGASRGFGGSPRTWRVHTPVGGSHEVTMPEGARTDLPFLSLTNPGGHDTTIEDNRAHLYWDDVDSGSVTVRYYLVRDLYLFGGLLVIGGLAGIGGATYYYRAIQRAREKRQEFGLDVEEEDDDLDDDGPPPGVR